MKKDVRFLGIDDSPFTFDDERVRILGVVTRGPSYVEGVLSRWVDVDGTDATDVVGDLIASTRFRPMLRAVFFNGVTLGGFNLLDLDALWKRLAIPLVAIVRDEPSLPRSRAALRKHFTDAETRLAVWERSRPSPVANGTFRVWCSWRGLGADEVPGVLAATTVRGAIPEPLRLAHVIGSGVASGESRGRV